MWLDAFLENCQNCCHQMSDCMAKLHQIRFRLGLQPRPPRGAYSAPPDPLAWFKGPTSVLLRGGEGVLDLSASSFWQSWLRAWKTVCLRWHWQSVNGPLLYTTKTTWSGPWPKVSLRYINSEFGTAHCRYTVDTVLYDSSCRFNFPLT